MAAEIKQIKTRAYGGALIASAGALAAGSFLTKSAGTFQSLLRHAPVSGDGILAVATLVVGAIGAIEGVRIAMGALDDAHAFEDVRRGPSE
ncbi:MAG: hypothetical protein KGI04_04905 [Candidatus Micrarchaeota archaeon]|nr:hypothetical protein [Candidatus Micrarchaeota archaeon]